MLIEFLQAATRKHAGHVAPIAHLGPAGLFFLAILDGSPVPTFGGPDIVTAVLAGTHRNSWYECAAVATLGSVIGAYFTFSMARRAGTAYLQSKFRNGKLSALLRVFQRWGLGALAASTAIPFPFPTCIFFAAAGASRYRLRTFLTVVTVCRAVRYSLIAILADHYGRTFIRAIRHPAHYWAWLLFIAAIICGVISLVVLMNKQLKLSPADDIVSTS